MKIRDAMKDQGELLVGIIEMDDMYVGGKPRKCNRRDDDDSSCNLRGRDTSKMPVVGMIERNGCVETRKKAGLCDAQSLPQVQPRCARSDKKYL